jgi:uncharacterized membrane protein YedE/YeeE
MRSSSGNDEIHPGQIVGALFTVALRSAGGLGRRARELVKLPAIHSALGDRNVAVGSLLVALGMARSGG